MNFKSQIRFIGGHASPFALIVPHQLSMEINETRFITHESESLQLGLIARPSGFKFPPHSHRKQLREVSETREVLVVKKGVCKLVIYNDDGHLLDQVMLYPGDVAMLIRGGHSLEAVEDLELIEIKQGPYLGFDDKFSIEPITR